MERLPSLTEEVSKIGSSETESTERDSKDAIQSMPPTAGSKDTTLSVETFTDDKKDKELEDYPRPLAVVGVSVL